MDLWQVEIDLFEVFFGPITLGPKRLPKRLRDDRSCFTLKARAFSSLVSPISANPREA